MIHQVQTRRAILLIKFERGSRIQSREQLSCRRLSEDIPQFLKPTDNTHNSLNLAAKICSDICPRVRFSEQIMSADKYPSIFSRQMKAIVYIVYE